MQHAGSNAELIERGRRVTATAGYDIGTRFSSVIASASGAWLSDVEGRRILDLTAASGTVILGHRHPAVTAAVVDQVENHGTMFASTLSVPRIELAERLCERYPCAEKAVFVKTGSEGTAVAARLARAATGRRLILTAGYHGWHDWQLSSQELGYVPSTAMACFGYNDYALEQMLTEFGDDVAAVMVSPELLYFEPDYYRAMAEKCRRHGALFILDEIYTGFRCGSRGLHGSLDVPADLVVISKGLANGHPLCAVLGSREVIDTYDAAGLQGTYNREVPSMAAALATLEVLDTTDAWAHAERMGVALMDGMREILRSAGVSAWVGGPPLMFDVVLPSEKLSWEIYRTAHDHGVYFEDSGTQLATAAFDDAAVDHALTAFDTSVRAVVTETDAVGGELSEEFKLDFAEYAFGGVLRDDADTRRRVDEVCARIAERDRTLGPEPRPDVEH